jgi:glycosyltransferase involved in cell wall biosynthesis
MKIGFVFTNFNNSNVTREAIQSIASNEFASDSLVVIVDNKSENIEIEILESIKLEYPETHFIFNNENIGYFQGLNVGIKYIRENHKDICYIIVGNNDLIFPAGFITSIYSKESIFEKYPVVSPDLIALDGVHQNPHVITKINKFRELIYDIYHISYISARMINSVARMTKKFTDRKDEQEFHIAQSIWQGYGACYILGPVFFKFFDQLWAPAFLMGEEFFLSKQLEDIEMKVFYDPDIKVNHQEHASVGKIPKKKLWEFSRDAHKIYRKYVSIWH